MATIRGTHSCAVAELSYISSGIGARAKPGGGYTNPVPASPELAVKAVMTQPPGSAVWFCERPTRKDGKKLVAYIRRNKLGTVRTITGPNWAYPDQHLVTMYMWLISRPRLKEFEAKMIADGKWDKNWRIDEFGQSVPRL